MHVKVLSNYKCFRRLLKWVENYFLIKYIVKMIFYYREDKKNIISVNKLIINFFDKSKKLSLLLLSIYICYCV